MKAKRILHKVQSDYEAISAEFDATRNRPWPEFSDLQIEMSQNLDSEQKLRVLDAGCGNGRLSDFLGENVEYIGVDNSKGLLKHARKAHPNGVFKYVDLAAKRLPFPDHYFDAVWCIAVLHHIPTATLRAQILKEFSRILKPGGMLGIMVWNLRQGKYKKFIQASGTTLIPWLKGTQKMRWFYAFTPTEIRALYKNSGYTKVKKILSKYNLVYAGYNKKGKLTKDEKN